MLRAGHPALVDGDLPLSAYLACEHVMIAPRGRAGSIVDRHLQALGHRRRVMMRIPEMLLGPLLVADSDLVLTAGERLLGSFVDRLAVTVVELPFEVPPFDVSLVWHGRSHDDPEHRWFRQLLATAHGATYEP